MDEQLLENWNSVVKPGDKVYHLGDVMFGDKTTFKSLWPKFHGKKRLVVGNHDDVKFLSAGGFFDKVMLWRWFDNLLLTHVPVHHYTLQEARGGHTHSVNVHGHTHTQGSPVGPYMSVCVELINYTPVHIEELKKGANEIYDKELANIRSDINSFKLKSSDTRFVTITDF
jgi:calcineurin-like phosphoesterase family protein